MALGFGISGFIILFRVGSEIVDGKISEGRIEYSEPMSGYTGSMQDFSRTTLSLLNLVLYIIPLVSLVIGVISFSSDGRFNELILAV